MSEIVAAIDETAANQLFHTLVSGLPPQSTSGANHLGPFWVTYTASGTLSPGSIDLIPPRTIRVADLRLNWSVTAHLQLRLGDCLPNEIPRLCITIPCVGRVCTPRIPLHWPTISIPIGLSDFLKATVDLELVATHVASHWKVEGLVQGIPNLQWGPGTAGMLALIGLAVSAAVAWIPLIGPFLAILVAAVTAAIGVAGLLGWLGPILSPFIAGTRFPIYDRSDQLEILGVEGPYDPAVNIRLDQIMAEIQHNAPEDELVLSADISS